MNATYCALYNFIQNLRFASRTRSSFFRIVWYVRFCFTAHELGTSANLATKLQWHTCNLISERFSLEAFAVVLQCTSWELCPLLTFREVVDLSWQHDVNKYGSSTTCFNLHYVSKDRSHNHIGGVIFHNNKLGFRWRLRIDCEIYDCC